MASASDKMASASDKMGSASDKMGSASDEMGSASDEIGSASDEIGSASDEMGSASDEMGSASDKMGSSSDEMWSASDKMGSGDTDSDGQKTRECESAAGKGQWAQVLLEIAKCGDLSDDQLLDVILALYEIGDEMCLLELFNSEPQNSPVLEQFSPTDLGVNIKKMCLFRICLFDGYHYHVIGCARCDKVFDHVDQSVDLCRSVKKDFRKLFNMGAFDRSEEFDDLYRRFFKIGLRHFIKKNKADSLVALLGAYFCHLNVNYPALKDDWQFACLKVLNAGMFNIFVDHLLQFSSESKIDIALDVVFDGSGASVTAEILRALPADEDTVEAVVKALYRAEQWQTHVAVVDEWLSTHRMHRKLRFGDFLTEVMRQSESCTRKKMVEWCVENSFFNLAFVLGFFMKRFLFLEMLLTEHKYTPAFDVYQYIEMAADESLGHYFLAAYLLRHLTVGDFDFSFGQSERRRLAVSCQKVGLLKWAAYFGNWNVIMELLEAGLDDKDFVNLVLEKALKADDGDKWRAVEKLMMMCSSPGLVFDVLRDAASRRQHEFVNAVLSTARQQHVGQSFLWSSCNLGEFLLWMINEFQLRNYLVRRSTQNVKKQRKLCDCEILELLRILVKSGVSPLSRADSAKTFQSLKDCFSTSVKGRVVGIAIKLMIESGAVSYRALDQLRKDKGLQDRMSGMVDGVKQAYTAVVEAAATPCSLKLVASLAMSDIIGCHPGRTHRINKLPVYSKIKNQISFNRFNE